MSQTPRRDSATLRIPPELLKALVALCFACYLAALVKITIIKGSSLSQIATEALAGRAPLRAVNLVPFQTWHTYLAMRGSLSLLRRFSNLAGNMLIFMPLGLYLPMVFGRMRTFRTTLLVVAASSLVIETLQYVLGTGSTDIDDLWLNSAGGALGYGVSLLVVRPPSTLSVARLRTLALSMGFAAAGYVVAYREFGLYLGLTTLRTEVQGGAAIPTRPAEALGVVTRSDTGAFVLARISYPKGASAEVVVRVSPGTQFFERHGSLKGNVQTFRYEPSSPGRPAAVPTDVMASAWGRWDGERLIADVVWTMPPPSATPGVTPFVTRRHAAPGLALPSTAPTRIGTVKSVGGDQVVIFETRELKLRDRLLLVTGKATDTLVLTGETSFLRQEISDGGREVRLLRGRREDVAPRAMIRVWGGTPEGRLVADVVVTILAK